MARWWQTLFSNAKSHIFPLTLRPRLERNFKDRGFELLEPPEHILKFWASRETTEAGLHLGGMGWKFDSWEEFFLPGLKLKLLSRQVEDYLECLENLGPRSELGRPYYKLHGDRQCLCLLPQHREHLLGLLRERLPVAREIGAIEAKEINRRLDAMNKHPNIDLKRREREGKKVVRA